MECQSWQQLQAKKIFCASFLSLFAIILPVSHAHAKYYKRTDQKIANSKPDKFQPISFPKFKHTKRWLPRSIRYNFSCAWFCCFQWVDQSLLLLKELHRLKYLTPVWTKDKKQTWDWWTWQRKKKGIITTKTFTK